MRQLTAMTVSAVVLAATVTGCGLDTNAAMPFSVAPGSIKPMPSLQGKTFTVGSKDFTENRLLGYMAEMALNAAGAKVNDLTNIQGSNSTRQALRGGELDLYWEYTGTGWINYQGNELPMPGGERAQFEATKAADEQKFGITWLDYSPVNNQYGFATTQAYAQQHSLKTVSDLAELLKVHPDQAVYCTETEFASRQDGFPGAAKTYGLPQGQHKNFGTGAIYTALANGTCPIGEITTTDGRIAGLKLQPLTDDKQTFPQYNAAVTLRTETLAQNPDLREVLEPVGKALDNQQMIELCKQVDVDGRDHAEVARDWMVAKGFITAGSA